MNSIILCFIIIFCTNGCSCSPQCLDDYGNQVDWSALYKLPKIKGHSNYNIAYGTAYAYITSKSKNGWRLSKYNISDPLSIPGKTLAIMYGQENTNTVDEIFWLLYNDQPPDEPFTLLDGHTKGIVLGDQDGGVWIVHSIPKYPTNNSSGYSYPHSGYMYGQSFLCISLQQKDLDSIGTQLVVNWAHTYDYKFEGNLDKKYPNLFKAAKKERNAILQNKIKFSSLQNLTFISFAKSSKFGADLYGKWVAGTLRTELYVESWLRETKLPSYCNSSYPVHNIQKLDLKPGVCSFDNYKDHSKYAISSQAKKAWVCIGDINRDKTQFIRAGGTVCFQDKDAWSAYFNIVASIEPCPRTA